MYTPQVIDHFERPRNVGEIESPDASARVENPVCGDLLHLSLKLNEGRISEARFRAKGCVPSIAAGSALTEMLLGKSLPEARAITRQDIVAALGGLSNESMHVSHLAADALQQALRALPASPRD